LTAYRPITLEIILVPVWAYRLRNSKKVGIMFSVEKTTVATLTFYWIVCKKKQTKIVFLPL